MLEEIKRRSTLTTLLVKQLSFERNKQWIGWSGEILIDEIGKMKDSWVGRNFAYKPIAVKSQENLLGKTIKVKVTQAFPTYLSGNIIP